MKTILIVEGMSCNHCVEAVKNAVSTIAGVENVEVNLETKEVTVEHIGNLSIDVIKNEIEDQGYDVVGTK